jgi:hypothetical protein
LEWLKATVSGLLHVIWAKIVWPVVKEAIAGGNENAMRDLATAAKVKKVVSGVETVGGSLWKQRQAPLHTSKKIIM